MRTAARTAPLTRELPDRRTVTVRVISRASAAAQGGVRSVVARGLPVAVRLEQRAAAEADHPVGERGDPLAVHVTGSARVGVGMPASADAHGLYGHDAAARQPGVTHGDRSGGPGAAGGDEVALLGGGSELLPRDRTQASSGEYE